MTISVAGEGELTGTIAMRSIDDPRPSLAFALRIPVRIEDTDAMLLVELRHPEARGWRELQGRVYRFDESTRRYTKADGTTIALDDVVADLRTTTGFFDVVVSSVAFGEATAERIGARIEGSARVGETRLPFVLDATLHIGCVEVRGDAREAADSLIADRDYLEPRTSGGVVVYPPRFGPPFL